MLIDEWPTSLAAWERSKNSLGGGVSTGLRASMPPHPLCFDHGRGAQITDIDGHTYTDYVLAWGPLVLGHCHPAIETEVAAQLQRGATFGSGHRLEHEVAEQVLEALGWADRILWSNTGTEASQSALRLARAHTGRQRVLKMTGNYHGWHDPMLVSYRGPEAATSPHPTPGTRGQSVAAMSDVDVVPFNDMEAAVAALRDSSRDLAAVIVEPVLNNSGVLEADREYLRTLREVCSETGTVLIFDDVINGFRLALGGSREHFGVTPDLVLLAKGIAGGYSLAAIAGRADIIDQVTQGVVHAGTYNGNGIALAAAHATVGHLAETKPFERMAGLASRLAGGMDARMRAHGVRGHAHAVGAVAQLALGIDRLDSFADYMEADWDRHSQLIVELLRRGQFTMPGGRLYISTEHTTDDIDATLAAFDDAMAALKSKED